MVLEADNEAMDLLQACRQLSRLLLTERYELLLDAAYQVRLTYEPIYRPVLDHCMSELRDSARLGRLEPAGHQDDAGPRGPGAGAGEGGPV